MSYFLPPHISFGQVGARTVLLDLRADRYFLLGDVEAAALRAECEDGKNTPILDRLVRRGFLGRGRGAAVRPVGELNICRSALECEGKVKHISVREVGFHRSRAALMLRLAGLGRTIEAWRLQRERWAMGQSGGARRVDREDAAGEIARGCAAARLFVPAQKLCLPDSLALVRALWSRNVPADLYFGVQLAPFTAHCWVQHADLLLSDPLDKVAEFSPVFRL